MMALEFFAVGVVSAWAIGMLSRGGLSQNPRTRMWLIFAAISALVGSAAGMVKRTRGDSQLLKSRERKKDRCY